LLILNLFSVNIHQENYIVKYKIKYFIFTLTYILAPDLYFFYQKLRVSQWDTRNYGTGFV